MQFGEFKLQIISAGHFSLDGGSVFGLVPKAIWNKQIAADEQNRIRLALNCLLIQRAGKNILVDCGLGDKFGPKQRDIFKLNQEPTLEEALNPFCKPEEIDYLLLTHLHFDHAGGVSRYNAEGQLELCFPRAKVVVQKKEWEAACHPSERNKGSYPADNITPLEAAGCLQLVEGDHTLMPGIELLFSGGHSAGHQLIKISSKGNSALYVGDLMPTAHHLRLPFITAFDVEPEETLKVKKKILAQAADEGWLLIFKHDTQHETGYVEKVSREAKTEYTLRPATTTLAGS